jgi:hypothetical protein
MPVMAFDIQSGRIKSGPMITQIDIGRFPFASFITSAHPGAMLAVSANGPNVETGVVWASHYRDLGKGVTATTEIHEGVLESFDATNLNLLWSSDGKPADRVGYFQKFTPPTIANGKVYLAVSPSPARNCIPSKADPDPCLTYDRAGSDGRIVVYGELPRRWLWEATPEVRHP